MKKKVVGIELNENLLFLVKKYLLDSEFSFSFLRLPEYNPRELIGSGDIFLIIVEKDSLLEEDLRVILPPNKIPLLILDKNGKEGKLSECIYSINMPTHSGKFISMLRRIEDKKKTRYIKVKTAGNFKKLYVVDEGDFFEKYKKKLIEKKFIVKQITSYHNFINDVSKEKPNVILVNIDLNRDKLLEYIEEIKRDEKFSHLPVIIMSQKNEIDDVKTGFILGAEEFIPKPFEIDELVRLINKVCSENPYLKNK